ncbi:MAG: DNA/RNA non-specific endonuclease [Eubacterium sp.]|nr:DNA/RNA non-specific endonuclease [Eubacterium sp.]
MEVLAAIKEVAVETVKEVAKDAAEVAKKGAKEVGGKIAQETEHAFPKFFESEVEITKAEVNVKSNEGNVFPSFFNNIETLEDENEITEIDMSEKYEPNSTMEVNGHIYETDDNGNIFKVDGKLNPDSSYTVNGTTYKTDSLGRPISWNGEPTYNPEAERDGEAQKDAGGADREEGDDGGHIVARVLNGSPGSENIVAMRDTVNRGDYKKAENEIADAKTPPEIKDVKDSGKIVYEGDSARPTKIERTYIIDGVKKELTVDNVEGSKDLVENIKNDISEIDYQNLTDRISDMEEDDGEVSVTSVLKEYDSNGNLSSVTVGVRDEIAKTKTYIKFEGSR